MFDITVLQQVLVEVRQPVIDSKVLAIDDEFVRNSFARWGNSAIGAFRRRWTVFPDSTGMRSASLGRRTV